MHSWLRQIGVWGLLGMACLPAPYARAENAYGPPSSLPENLFPFGDHVYFSALDGIHGRELWRVDFDGNKELVRDITEGPGDSTIDRFHAFGGAIYFRVSNSRFQGHLWKTDGTEAGTVEVVTSTMLNDKLGVSFILGSNAQYLFFLSGRDDNGGLLYVTDGTAEGTRPVRRDSNGMDIMSKGNHAAIFHDELFFGGWDNTPQFGIWRTDGTEAGTSLVRRMHRLSGLFTILDGDRLVFSGFGSPDEGNELWITQGTEESTLLLKDIYPGPESSDPEQHFLWQTENPQETYILFAATDPANGREVWITDGTPEGTRLLADVVTGAGSSSPYKFFALGDTVYFVASGADSGKEWWRYRHPSGAVDLVMDINPGLAGSDPYELSAGPNSDIYFSALSPDSGEELWTVSSGDPPELLEDIYPGPESSFPFHTVMFHNSVVTVATSPTYGRELWIRRERQPLVLLADVFSDASVNPSSHPREITPMDDYFFLVANDLAHGNELWRSDGSEQGTYLVKDIFQGTASSNPENLNAVGRLLYFRAEDGTNGVELWQSDGTPEGTAMTLNIHPDGDASPKHLTEFRGMLLFTAYRPYDGEEPWILEPDRKPRILKNIADSAQSSSPEAFVVWRDHAYFLADDLIHGRELWRTDGTAEGTVLVRDIVNAPFENFSLSSPRVVQGNLYFSANPDGRGEELWAMDDSSGVIRIVRDIATPATFDVLRVPRATLVLAPAGVAGGTTANAGRKNDE